MKSENVKKALRILDSSERPMPARYCGCSFMIDWDGLTETDEYEMASVASCETDDLPNYLPKEDYILCIRFGEDYMLGTFILCRISKKEDIPNDVAKLQVELRRRFFSFFRSGSHFRVVFDDAEKYFDYCRDYGMKRALMKAKF